MTEEQAVQQKLNTYKNELKTELKEILNYWIKYAPDHTDGGFYGRIDNNNSVITGSPKGSVLNARILWSFSAAYRLDRSPVYLEMAKRAYGYIVKHFIDLEQEGVYWSVDHLGKPLDSKKQVYAIAFTIYAFSEFYLASHLDAARKNAIHLYHLLVEKSYDAEKTGYFEAFTREWRPINDLRLSAKDANEKKTMNTHLHVLEAYTTLYRIWPAQDLRLQIITLIHNFLDHFIDAETGHLLLFFDEDWNSKSKLISYGHDIEATWLLLEAAVVTGDGDLIEKVKAVSIRITETTVEGLDADGGLWYEYEPAENNLVKEKHWWVQAEAMVGFYNTWQITGDEKYLGLSVASWQFVKDKIRDTQNGEWFWGVKADGSVMVNEDKIGLWKCPYHNSRACIEIIKRTL